MGFQNTTLRAAAGGLCLLLLGGCANGIHDQVVGGHALLGEAKVGALSTTANYRTVVAKFDQASIVCPEPPPDVAVAITSALTASMEVTSQSLDATAKANMARAIAQNITPLLRRTAAIQFYRDARSYNCFAHMNGALDANAYVAANTAALTAATNLMSQEIEQGFEPIDPQVMQNDLHKIIEYLEELKKQESAPAK
ncbi:hypothetical protein [Thalassospira sp.]|uniref:hypothetical protein n=1 Tax=Thalassospira sp. TaxID=1912094 RepID=UPI00273448C3|nr:hypothetical protein [Thalassospira sp.]MDP2697607.1 hypothetical protein [Thalassospira sp.]